MNIQQQDNLMDLIRLLDDRILALCSLTKSDTEVLWGHIQNYCINKDIVRSEVFQDWKEITVFLYKDYKNIATICQNIDQHLEIKLKQLKTITDVKELNEDVILAVPNEIKKFTSKLKYFYYSPSIMTHIIKKMQDVREGKIRPRKVIMRPISLKEKILVTILFISTVSGAIVCGFMLWKNEWTFRRCLIVFTFFVFIHILHVIEYFQFKAKKVISIQRHLEKLQKKSTYPIIKFGSIHTDILTLKTCHAYKYGGEYQKEKLTQIIIIMQHAYRLIYCWAYTNQYTAHKLVLKSHSLNILN